MIDASVGEYLISDDVSTVSSSTMTDEPTTGKEESFNIGNVWSIPLGPLAAISKETLH